MHETSLVRSLLTQVEQIMIQHEATSVDSVTVEIGPLSGVEGDLVQAAFLQLSPTVPGMPQLVIREIGLQILCRDCEVESAVAGLTLQCPICRSPRVQILRGDEFRLIDVSIQVPVALKGDEQ